MWFIFRCLSNDKIIASINERVAKMLSNSFPIFHSVEPILRKLEENKSTEGVQELLNIYNKAKQEKAKSDAESKGLKMHPLIVLEGLDGSGKTSTSTRFARQINAVKWNTPPKSTSHIRALFDDNKVLRTAYYSLGNYIAALEVQVLLKSSPVVMDRYWHSTAAYAIAECVQNEPNLYKMPLMADPIYKWPEDLFKPDVIFLLNVSEEIRKQRQSRRRVVTEQEDLLNNEPIFRKNILEAYSNMYDPSVMFIDSNNDFNFVLRILHEKTAHLLK